MNSATAPEMHSNLSLMFTLQGVLAVGWAVVSAANQRVSYALCLFALISFVVSLIASIREPRRVGVLAARCIDIFAISVASISFGAYWLIEPRREPVQAPRTAIASAKTRRCISRLVTPRGRHYFDDKELGSVWVPIAPPWYLYERLTIDVDDNGLRAEGYVHGRSFHVFWVHWGDVDLKLDMAIYCEGVCLGNRNNCKADCSTSGVSSATDGVVRGVAHSAEVISGNEVRTTVAMSGSIAARGGPSLGIGKEPLKVDISWPDASAEWTLQAGSYKWRCECGE